MADPYAPVTGNGFYNDFSGSAGRQQFPWEDMTKGMTQDQYWNFIGTLAGARPSGFDQTLPVVSNQNLFPITQGYDPLSGFNYTNQYGGADNIFTPINVLNVETENQLNSQMMAEQQAAQAAAAASKPSLGAQIGYGLLGAATGIPGSLIQTGVNALGNIGGQNVVEGGMLPAYYTSGAPTGYVDAAGFPINPDTGLRYDVGAANVGGGGATAIGSTTAPRTSTASTTTTGTGEGPGEVALLDPFKVTDTSLPSVTLGNFPSSTLGSGSGGGNMSTVVGQSGGVNIMSPQVNTATGVSQPQTGTLAPYLLQQSGYVYNPTTNTYTMPQVNVPSGGGTTGQTYTLPGGTVGFNMPVNINTPTSIVGPVVQPATSTSSTTSTTSTTTTGTGAATGDNFDLGSLVGPATTTGTTGGRDFAKELAASTAALQAQQNNLMGMYGGIYQNLLGQTAIPQAAQQSLAQMQADAAKLQRVQQGYLSAEDARNATQAAREAYAARGQVMGPGAIGAEILNREAIRQQREDQARAAYQSSMGNVFNAANLQTGNIFSPIGSLVGQTFNPLGAYPQDVYSSNYNAAAAQQIAAMNNAAAIEAAKYGATAQKQAATTSGLFNLGANLIAKYLPKI